MILATYSSTMGMIYFLFPDGLAYLCTKVCPLVSKITEMLTLYKLPWILINWWSCPKLSQINSEKILLTCFCFNLTFTMLKINQICNTKLSYICRIFHFSIFLCCAVLQTTLPKYFLTGLKFVKFSALVQNLGSEQIFKIFHECTEDRERSTTVR